MALNRLAHQGLIASPAQGFYVIVPPEYRSLACLPADQFIPALMEWLDLPYYAGLLSAAQYYGAAHQRPQEFQVFVEKNRRPITCGKVRVAFIARKRLAEVSTRAFNTPRGTIAVSTPEATVFDLAGYPGHDGWGICRRSAMPALKGVAQGLCWRARPKLCAIIVRHEQRRWTAEQGMETDH